MLRAMEVWCINQWTARAVLEPNIFTYISHLTGEKMEGREAAMKFYGSPFCL